MTTQPLRVGLLARRRLARSARRDAAAVHDTETDRADATTPTLATLQARADAYARREEQRFFRGHAARADRAPRARLGAAQRPRRLRPEAGAAARRRTATASRRTASPRDAAPRSKSCAAWSAASGGRTVARTSCSALINARFTTAQLRAARMFDRSDEKTAIYWGALREATTGRVAPRPPALRRSEWLTARGNRRRCPAPDQRIPRRRQPPRTRGRPQEDRCPGVND